jgi:ABC-type proline/glycine betaine transport system permease subunit
MAQATALRAAWKSVAACAAAVPSVGLFAILAPPLAALQSTYCEVRPPAVPDVF